MSAKELTRNEFLRLSAGFVAASTLPFGLGCPTDDTGDEGASSAGTSASTSAGTSAGTNSMMTDGESTAGECQSDVSAMIGANHDHYLVVPIYDIWQSVDTTYRMLGAFTHSHEVTLTADHFAMLQAGMQVLVVSTVVDGHSHEVTVSC